MVKVHSDGSFDAIEGNTDVAGGRTGGKVMVRGRKYMGAGGGFGYPRYDGKSTSPKVSKGSSNGNASQPPRRSQTAPKFPWSKGHRAGVESNSKKNHSGAWSKDRAGIRLIQAQLKKRGWQVGVDGHYGTETRLVVKQFQKEKGLKVTGRVDAKTFKALWESPVT